MVSLFLVREDRELKEDISLGSKSTNRKKEDPLRKESIGTPKNRQQVLGKEQSRKHLTETHKPTRQMPQ